MMRVIKLTILTIFLLHNAFSIPRFAVKNGTTCVTCHVSSTGSGLRNDYGISIVSMDELPWVKGRNKTFEKFSGMVTDYLQLGADLRLQIFSRTDTVDTVSSRKTAIFPMQADMYGSITISKTITLYLEIDLLRSYSGSNELWTSLTLFPRNSYLLLGKKIPFYGLPVDDHTSFVRGGNLRLTHGLAREGMPFRPGETVPGMIELGFYIWDFFITGSISNGFVSQVERDYGFGESLSDKTLTGRLEYSNSWGKLKGLAGSSIMKEKEPVLSSSKDFLMKGLFGGLSWGSWVWLGEIDLADKWVGEGTSLASLSELTFEPKQGVQVYIKYDLFDEDIDSTQNALARTTVGLDFFPISFLEIKTQVRKTEVFGRKIQTYPEYLFQFHTWF